MKSMKYIWNSEFQVQTILNRYLNIDKIYVHQCEAVLDSLQKCPQVVASVY